MALLAAGGINLFPDETLLYQMGLFLLLIITLNFLIVRPTLRILKERERRTQGAQDAGDAMVREAQELEAQIQARIDAARRSAAEKQAVLTKKVEQEAQALVMQARNNAAAQAERAQSQLAEEAGRAQQTLEREVAQYADMIMQRLLHKQGAAS